MKNKDIKSTNIKWLIIRTVLNFVIIITDAIPVLAIPSSIIEELNVISVLANRVGIRVPSLTPNVSNAILGAGIIGEVFDTTTLELLPFPSSIFIHGAQILHDIRPIHEFVKANPKHYRYLPITEFLNSVSTRLLKNS